MYLISMIDDEALQLSTYTSNKEGVMEVVKRWHKANYSQSNDEGYIAVEEAINEGEDAERVFQVDLDDEPEEVESYLDEIYIKLD
ncbi:hypothetical protein MZM54_04105 [[Brevibacterium] frigoritolerans]|nr:hypothetical protein [Peribacillus frigoritolerans]